MSEVLSTVAQNPNISGFALFLLLFLPLFGYFLKQAANEKREQREFSREMLCKSEEREKVLVSVIRSEVAENTQALIKMDSSINKLTDRVGAVERKLGVDPC